MKDLFLKVWVKNMGAHYARATYSNDSYFGHILHNSLWIQLFL